MGLAWPRARIPAPGQGDRLKKVDIEQYDVCIIGSGAGAAPVAHTLAKAGYRVILLEKGPWLKEGDFTKDEIAVSRRPLYTPRLEDEQHVMETYENGRWVSERGSDLAWSFWNGSMVGGSSNLMSGFFHRMKPEDFRLKSSYGTIEGANVVDWPISYDDLEPYYTKVEALVGVSGRVVKHPNQEPRSTESFPYPPTWEHPITELIDSACGRLGYHSIPTPRAVLPSDAMGRKGCSYSNFCGSYGCATGAKGNARSALLDDAVATGNCTILAESFVFRLESDAGGSVTQAHYYDKAGKHNSIRAHLFVVAAQAIETSRLLLNSQNRYFPRGLANNGGQVGKNLIFSAGGVGQGRFELDKLGGKQRDFLHLRGAFVNRSLQEWYSYEHKGKRLKGGTIDFLFEHANPVKRAMSELYDDAGNLQWGRALQEKLLHTFTQTRTLTFEVFNDWLPTDECYVTLDESTKDKWGLPVGKMRLNAHEHDLQVGKFLAEKGESVLRAMGAVDVRSHISPSPPPNLVAGGCRFGDDPKTSVLDRNCKAHELSNLYVTDGSFMPTGGSVPYTWTIYANAFRVADVIAGVLKRKSAAN